MKLKTYSQLQILQVCRGCKSRNLEDFIHYAQLPLAGIYLRESEFGQEPVFPLTVTFCDDCKLIQLREILPNHVYTDYRFSGSGSTAYRSHLEWVAESLVNQWGLAGKRVLEIGCNDGYLLKQLRDKGRNQIYGYEPSAPLRAVSEGSGVPVSCTFFNSSTLSECPNLPVDAVIVRHVLEHIDDLQDFLTSIKAALAPTGLLVIEVPDGDSILAKGFYSHFYHEHLSYFSISSLRRILGQYGFTIIDHRVVDVHGSSLYVICKLGNGSLKLDVHQESEREITDAARKQFAADMHVYYDQLHEFVEKESRAGVRFAGYGAAHRTVVMCSLAGITRKHLGYLVDKNFHLHGLYSPGEHFPIYSPEFLYQDCPNAVIVFATSFEKEIILEQKAFREKGGRFVSITSKPQYLP